MSWTTKVEDKGEMHGSDIHINNSQVRSQTFKKHFAPSWTILLPRKSSSSFTLNICNLLTSTWIQKGHRPFQHGPYPHSHENGKQSLGETGRAPRALGAGESTGEWGNFQKAELTELERMQHIPCQQKLPETGSGAPRHGESRVGEDIIWQERYKKIGGQVLLVGLEK